MIPQCRKHPRVPFAQKWETQWCRKHPRVPFVQKWENSVVSQAPRNPICSKVGKLCGVASTPESHVFKSGKTLWCRKHPVVPFVQEWENSVVSQAPPSPLCSKVGKLCGVASTPESHLFKSGKTLWCRKHPGVPFVQKWENSVVSQAPRSPLCSRVGKL